MKSDRCVIRWDGKPGHAYIGVRDKDADGHVFTAIVQGDTLRRLKKELLITLLNMENFVPKTYRGSRAISQETATRLIKIMRQ